MMAAPRAATVGASGTAEFPSPDFATLRAALNAGHRMIDVVNDTLENGANIVLASTSGLSVRMYNGATIDMRGGSLDFNGPGLVEIRGNGVINADGAVLLANNLILDGIELRCNSSSNTNIFSIDADGSAKMQNSRFLLGRVSSAFIGSRANASLNGCTFVGRDDGSQSQESIDAAAGAILQLNNCVFEGDFNNTVPALGGHAVGSRVTYSNVEVRPIDAGASNMQMRFVSDQVLDNFRVRSDFGNPIVTFRAQFGVTRRAKVTNCDLGTLGGFTGGTGEEVSDSYFSNVTASGTSIQPFVADSKDNRMVNCVMGRPNAGGSTLLTGRRHYFSNCRFLPSSSVTIQGSGHVISNCEFNAPVVFDAATSGIIMTNCRAPGVTDNGTNNAIDFFQID
jgi:hypothetical protein